MKRSQLHAKARQDTRFRKDKFGHDRPGTVLRLTPPTKNLKMRKKDLKDPTANPDFISGIYNYCDRWCERCSFTSRCLLYANERDDPDLDDPQVRDINNEKFWRKLQSIFRSTSDMIAEWAAETGVDLDSVDVSAEMADHDRKLEAAQQSEITQAAHQYAMSTEAWLRETGIEAIIENELNLETATDDNQIDMQDAVEIIRWYQFFIEVKLVRALTGATIVPDAEMDDDSADDFFPDFASIDDDDFDSDEVVEKSDRMDSYGSAKVALVAIDRSIAAWRTLQISLPTKSDTIKPLLIALGELRRAVETRFRRARDFVRPGLDELHSDLVS